MIKKILAFIVLVGCMQTALYAQENQNRTLINAALHGWEYEIRAGVSIGGTSPLPLPVEIRSIDAYNPTLAFMLEGNAIKWLGTTKKLGCNNRCKTGNQKYDYQSDSKELWHGNHRK